MNGKEAELETVNKYQPATNKFSIQYDALYLRATLSEGFLVSI